jgi:hypothetical protein
MTNRSRRSAEDRAEARRRTRYAAQGRADDSVADDEEEAEAAAPSQPSGSFLSRLFPPAPPLPGKPDPLAGFGYQGPFRGVVAGLYLLARHPVPWIGMGAVWALGRLLLVIQFDVLAILSSLIAFGALIAAGWIGWPRPWLFGVSASIFGILLYASLSAAIVGPAHPRFTEGEVFAGSIYQEVLAFQPLFGAIAGWYGGYLRRRMAATSASARARPTRRR